MVDGKPLCGRATFLIMYWWLIDSFIHLCTNSYTVTEDIQELDFSLSLLNKFSAFPSES